MTLFFSTLLPEFFPHTERYVKIYLIMRMALDRWNVTQTICLQTLPLLCEYEYIRHWTNFYYFDFLNTFPLRPGRLSLLSLVAAHATLSDCTTVWVANNGSVERKALKNTGEVSVDLFLYILLKLRDFLLMEHNLQPLKRPLIPYLWI